MLHERYKNRINNELDMWKQRAVIAEKTLALVEREHTGCKNVIRGLKTREVFASVSDIYFDMNLILFLKSDRFVA